MPTARSRSAARQKRHSRLRLRVAGSAERPRLAVFRSINQIYAQVIDDEKGVTLASASSLEKEVSGSASNTGNAECGKLVGKAIADRAKEVGIETVVFDRGGFNYHGVISAIAEAALEGGLKF